MEITRFKTEEFNLYNFIDFYNDNKYELLTEYPNYISRIWLIDKDYMDVVTFNEDYENLTLVKDYVDLLVNGDYALNFIIGKTYENAEKVEIIDGSKFVLNHYIEDIYENDNTIRNIGDLNLNVDNLIGLLFDYEEEEKEISVSLVDFEHGGEISEPRIRQVDCLGDFKSIVESILEKFINH